MSNAYLDGLNVILGDAGMGGAPSAPSWTTSRGPSSKYLTIRFTNPAAIIARHGGKLGAFAHTLAPEAVEDYAYADVKKTIEENLKKEDVSEYAEVRLISGTPPVEPKTGKPKSEFLPGVVTGVGAVVGFQVLGFLVWQLFRRRP